MLYQYISNSKPRKIALIVYLIICTILLFIVLGSLYNINPDNITNNSIRSKIWNARRAADGLGVMIAIAVGMAIAYQLF